jgi:predicted transcriptional regulator
MARRRASRKAEKERKALSNFQMPVSLYMSTPAYTVREDADLREAQRRLSGLAVSSLVVVDAQEQPVGVISRTDLIQVGQRQAGAQGKAALLTLPEMPISRRMTRELVTVSADTPVAEAARQMVEGRFHRVYVTEAGKLAAVLSTRDVMLAIRDKRVRVPISSAMSSPVFTIRHNEPISLATERLGKARVTGLVVVEDGWPVGLYTQREALEAKDEARETPVEAVMSAAMLALDVGTPIFRAAEQAAVVRVRRVIAVKGQRMEGILTGLDFAGVAM